MLLSDPLRYITLTLHSARPPFLDPHPAFGLVPLEGGQCRTVQDSAILVTF